MKILITGGKTATALKLIKAFDGAEILLGDYGDMPNINANSYSFLGLGKWNEEILAHNLLTKCLDYGVNALLPLYDAEIGALSKSLVLFEEFGLKVLIPENPQIKHKKAKHWAVFENGRSVYTTVKFNIEEKEHIGLNGVYHFDDETNELSLISISNPI